MKPEISVAEGSLSFPVLSPTDRKGLLTRTVTDWLLLFLICAGTYLPFIEIFSLPVGSLQPLLLPVCLLFSFLFTALFFFHKIAIWALPLCSAGWCVLVWNTREIFVQGFILCVNQIFSACEEELGGTFPHYLVKDEAVFRKEEYCFLFILVLMFVLMEITAWGVIRLRSAPLVLVLSVPFLAAPLLIGSLHPLYALIPVLASIAALFLRFTKKEYVRQYVYQKRLRIASEGDGGKTASAVFCTALAVLTLIWAVFPPETFKRPEAIDELRVSAEDFFSSFGKQPPSDDIVWEPSSQFTSSRVDLASKGDLDFSGKTVLKIRCDSPADIYLRGFTGGTYTHSSWRILENRAYENLSSSLNRYNPLLYWGGSQAAPYSVSHIEIDALGETSSMLAPQGLKTLPADAEYSFDQSFVFQVPKQQYSLTAYSASMEEAYQIGPRASMTQFLCTIAQYYDENGEGFEDAFTMEPDRNRAAYLRNLSASVQGALSADALAFLQAEMDYRQFALYQYTRIPDDLSPYLDTVLETIRREYWRAPQEGDSGLQPLVDAVTGYLTGTCRYSLSPGTTPPGEDFTRYFLEESREGYCVHFATAATLLFRSMGIPARYVEGYIVPQRDFGGSDAEGWVHVSDERGHAWAEIYVPLYGWVPVETTPGYSEGSAQNPNMPYPEEEEPSEMPEESSSETAVPSAGDEETSSPSLPAVSSPASSPANQSEGGEAHFPAGILLGCFSCILLAGFLWFMRRLLMKGRQKRASDPDRIRAVLFLYRTAEKICRPETVPEPLQSLAEKAAFSRQPIMEEEYQSALEAAENCRLQKLAALPRWKRSLFRLLYGSLRGEEASNGTQNN